MGTITRRGFFAHPEHDWRSAETFDFSRRRPAPAVPHEVAPPTAPRPAGAPL